MNTSERTFVVERGMPPPARRLLNLVQRVLKCTPQIARREIRGGHVAVNRRTILDSDLVLRPGDTVAVAPLPARHSKQRPTQESWQLEHEDHELVVVDKPAGLLTVPSPHGEKRTMIALLTRYIQQRVPDGQAFSVHRLDRDVSGLLVFAKSLAVAQLMRDQFATRKPERQYVALVAGVLDQDQGTIRSFLATDDQLNRYSVATEDEGELAITHYQTLERFDDATQLSIRLETGRRNQIRVHLAEMGHPIVGETRYRRSEAVHRHWPHRRLALHAARLAFHHPVTGQWMEFESPLPEPFRQFLRKQPRQRR